MFRKRTSACGMSCRVTCTATCQFVRYVYVGRLVSVTAVKRKKTIHTASTPCRARLPTSTLKTQWLLHFLSRARPSRPTMLLSVVFTDRPSKCIQSNGAGLLTPALAPPLFVFAEFPLAPEGWENDARGGMVCGCAERVAGGAAAGVGANGCV